MRACAALLSVLVLGVGCESSPAPDDPGPTPSPSAEASKVRRGGTLRFGVLGEPATLDPYGRYASDLTDQLVTPVFPTLFRVLPDGSIEPYLASGTEAVPGGIRVMLGEVRWSDGRRLSAADVVASARRATPRSGFARATSVRAIDERTVEFKGDVSEWRTVLARRSFILPRGRARLRVSAGPFRLRERVPGLRLSYTANRRFGGDGPLLDRLEVSHVQDLGTLIGLLRRGRLDAALVPSAVNLGDRLEARDLDFDARLGWEAIIMDLSVGGLSESARAELVSALDIEALHEGLIRSDGRVTRTLTPDPGPNGADGPATRFVTSDPSLNGLGITIAVPVGDELLEQLQRAIQIRLNRYGVISELISGGVSDFYGPWRERSPADIALMRTSGFPGLSGDAAQEGYRMLPLFHVKTYTVWRGRVRGVRTNASGAGPFWNAEHWWLDREPEGD